MEIQDWKASVNLNETYREIRSLGLETNLAELDSYGFTVVPDALPPGLLKRAKDKILALSEARSGVPVDVETGRTHVDRYQVFFELLLADPLFEEVLMNPFGLALVNYYLGRRSVLSSFVGVIRGPGGVTKTGDPLKLHCDSSFIPDPQPAYAQVFNVTWCLTDYSESNGSISFVPGSHKLCRSPRPGEADGLTTPIDAPAGSLIAFHGNTWHSNCLRTSDGVRVNMITFFTRMYIRPIEHYVDTLPDAAFERNAQRFATLMGGHIGYPYRKSVRGAPDVREELMQPLSAMDQFT